MQLSDYVGQSLAFMIFRLNPDVAQEAVLRGVEAGGVWVESQQLTNDLLGQVGVSCAPRTPVTFFPYHEIGFVIAFVPELSLNETALGV
jgi:hypothetical protein